MIISEETMIPIDNQNESMAGIQNEGFVNKDSKERHNVAKSLDHDVKIESEEEEEYEEIIDDESEEDEVDETIDNDAKSPAKKKEKEIACYGLGSLEQPLVKFYFTSPCPELGLEKVTQFCFYIMSSQIMRRIT